MKVLITGITGFVGAGLAHFLVEKQVEVYGTIRATSNLWRLNDIKSQITLAEVDLLDGKTVSTVVAEIKPDVILKGTPFLRQQF